MNNLILYRDKAQNFKCNLTIEGVSLKNTKARLLLEFSGGNTLLLKGNLDSNGNAGWTCVISNGIIRGQSVIINIIGEVIAFSNTFNTITSSFIIQKFTVTINSPGSQPFTLSEIISYS
jgi:hypothetical protein